MERVSHRTYTDHFKTQSVALSESIARTKAARQLEVPVKSLANWVDDHR